MMEDEAGEPSHSAFLAAAPRVGALRRAVEAQHAALCKALDCIKKQQQKEKKKQHEVDSLTDVEVEVEDKNIVGEDEDVLAKLMEWLAARLYDNDNNNNHGKTLVSAARLLTDYCRTSQNYPLVGEEPPNDVRGNLSSWDPQEAIDTIQEAQQLLYCTVQRRIHEEGCAGAASNASFDQKSKGGMIQKNENNNNSSRKINNDVHCAMMLCDDQISSSCLVSSASASFAAAATPPTTATTEAETTPGKEGQQEEAKSGMIGELQQQRAHIAALILEAHTRLRSYLESVVAPSLQWSTGLLSAARQLSDELQLEEVDVTTTTTTTTGSFSSPPEFMSAIVSVVESAIAQTQSAATAARQSSDAECRAATMRHAAMLSELVVASKLLHAEGEKEDDEARRAELLASLTALLPEERQHDESTATRIQDASCSSTVITLTLQREEKLLSWLVGQQQHQEEEEEDDHNAIQILAAQVRERLVHVLRHIFAALTERLHNDVTFLTETRAMVGAMLQRVEQQQQQQGQAESCAASSFLPLVFSTLHATNVKSTSSSLVAEEEKDQDEDEDEDAALFCEKVATCALLHLLTRVHSDDDGKEEEEDPASLFSLLLSVWMQYVHLQEHVFPEMTRPLVLLSKAVAVATASSSADGGMIDENNDDETATTKKKTPTATTTTTSIVVTTLHMVNSLMTTKQQQQQDTDSLSSSRATRFRLFAAASFASSSSSTLLIATIAAGSRRGAIAAQTAQQWLANLSAVVDSGIWSLWRLLSNYTRAHYCGLVIQQGQEGPEEEEGREDETTRFLLPITRLVLCFAPASTPQQPQAVLGAAEDKSTSFDVSVEIIVAAPPQNFSSVADWVDALNTGTTTTAPLLGVSSSSSSSLLRQRFLHKLVSAVASLHEHDITLSDTSCWSSVRTLLPSSVYLHLRHHANAAAMVGLAVDMCAHHNSVVVPSSTTTAANDDGEEEQEKIVPPHELLLSHQRTKRQRGTSTKKEKHDEEKALPTTVHKTKQRDLYNTALLIQLVAVHTKPLLQQHSIVAEAILSSYEKLDEASSCVELPSAGCLLRYLSKILHEGGGGEEEARRAQQREEIEAAKMHNTAATANDSPSQVTSLTSMSPIPSATSDFAPVAAPVQQQGEGGDEFATTQMMTEAAASPALVNWDAYSKRTRDGAGRRENFANNNDVDGDDGDEDDGGCDDLAEQEVSAMLLFNKKRRLAQRGGINITFNNNNNTGGNGSELFHNSRTDQTTAANNISTAAAPGHMSFSSFNNTLLQGQHQQQQQQSTTTTTTRRLRPFDHQLHAAEENCSTCSSSFFSSSPPPTSVQQQRDDAAPPFMRQQQQQQPFMSSPAPLGSYLHHLPSSDDARTNCGVEDHVVKEQNNNNDPTAASSFSFADSSSSSSVAVPPFMRQQRQQQQQQQQQQRNCIRRGQVIASRSLLSASMTGTPPPSSSPVTPLPAAPQQQQFSLVKVEDRRTLEQLRAVLLQTDHCKRLMTNAKQQAAGFTITAVTKVHNPVLRYAFEAKKQELILKQHQLGLLSSSSCAVQRLPMLYNSSTHLNNNNDNFCCTTAIGATNQSESFSLLSSSSASASCRLSCSPVTLNYNNNNGKMPSKSPRRAAAPPNRSKQQQQPAQSSVDPFEMASIDPFFLTKRLCSELPQLFEGSAELLSKSSIHSGAERGGGEKEEEELNEALMLHGTSGEVADLIAHNGFDERVSKTSGLFGTGTYVTNTLCKAHLYAKPTTATTAPQQGVGSTATSASPFATRSVNQSHSNDNSNGNYQQQHQHRRCLIIARVVLGDAYVTEKSNASLRRPPGKKPPAPSLSSSSSSSLQFYDSVVGNGKEHKEFVLYDRHMLLPEYVVDYTAE